MEALDASGNGAGNNSGGWRVQGLGGAPRGGRGRPLDCDVRESGTTCRLLTAVLAAGEGLFRVHGSKRMHERPIGDLTDALTRLGAGVAFEGKPGCPPLLLQAHGLNPRPGRRHNPPGHGYVQPSIFPACCWPRRSAPRRSA